MRFVIFVSRDTLRGLTRGTSSVQGGRTARVHRGVSALGVLLETVPGVRLEAMYLEDADSTAKHRA